MKKTLFLLYGFACYFIFFFTMLYLIGFVGDLVVPKSVDAGGEASLVFATLVNVVLIALFAIQHSIMARQWFKNWWTKWVPWPLERSTYVLFASLVLLLTFWLWQPMPGIVWDLSGSLFAYVMWALFGIGWTILFTSSFMIDHFELFGIKQVVTHYKGQAMPSPEFKTPYLYKHTRHPIYLGLLMGLWFIPTMTVSHLTLAIGYTVYVFIGVIYEERDLIRLFGDKYREYKKRVPMVFPFTNRKK